MYLALPGLVLYDQTGELQVNKHTPKSDQTTLFEAFASADFQPPFIIALYTRSQVMLIRSHWSGQEVRLDHRGPQVNCKLTCGQQSPLRKVPEVIANVSDRRPCQPLSASRSSEPMARSMSQEPGDGQPDFRTATVMENRSVSPTSSAFGLPHRSAAC